MVQPLEEQHIAGKESPASQVLPAVLLLGAVLLALHLLLQVIVEPLPSSVPSFASELFPWVKVRSSEMLEAFHEGYQLKHGWAFLACSGALFAVYGLLVGKMKGRQPARTDAVVFGGGALFLAAHLFSPVMLSTDIYAYALYGRLVSFYGTDAYQMELSMVASDPFHALYGHETPSVYGPLWTLISAGITWVGGTHIGLVVLLFKLVAVATVLLAAYFIWSILRQLAPERATQGLTLFLWNPLVITETGLSGHNDALLVMLALLGIWLHLRGHRALTVLALTLSALVKFVTGPLIPLYLLMAFRESRSWGDRLRLAGRAALGAVIATALISSAAHVKSKAHTMEIALSPAFYANNFHELIFKGVRYALGEEAASLNIPMDFYSWWIKTSGEVVLRAEPNENAAPGLHVNAGQPLLVISPCTIEGWLRVRDPATGQKGYLHKDSGSTIDFPEKPDPVSAQLQNGIVEWPTVLKANAWIRVVTYALFAAFGLLAAWRTVNFERFLAWAPAVMFAFYFTIMTQIWPWYMLWALALGALKPESLAAKWAVALSAGMMTLYFFLSYYCGIDDWLSCYRSIPTIVIPSLGVLLYAAWKKRATTVNPAAL